MDCEIRVAKQLVIILLLVLLAGCSVQSNRWESVSSSAGSSEAVQMELVGYDNQLAAELLATPLEFVVPYPDAAYAFERGRIFFGRFGGGVALSMRGKNESILGARKSIPGYRYTLTRFDTSSGARFSVRCERAISETGDFEPDSNGMRCKNLARFVKTGVIEDKLVTAQLPDPS